MEKQNLRIVSVVDAIQGRNGVGTYFQDLSAQLAEHVEHVELVAPSLDKPHACQGVSMPMPGDPTQRLYFPRVRRLIQLVLAARPHVIVLPGPGLFSLVGYWLAKKLGIPVCVTFQTDYEKLAELYWGPTLSRVAGGLLRWISLVMFRGAATVATISRQMSEQARQLGVAHPHLVGTLLAAEFAKRPITPFRGEVRSALFVGRLAAEKNIEQFLALSQAYPDIVFHVLGDGPLRHKVESCASRQGNVVYHGWQPRSVVIDFLDKTDLLILPSKVEAFGTVALEAMARQRLVITSPACGINLWSSLRAGLCVQGENESLPQTLERLLEMTANDRRALACAGHASAMALNTEALEQWLAVLRLSAAQRARLPRPRRSPTLALLKRLYAS